MPRDVVVSPRRLRPAHAPARLRRASSSAPTRVAARTTNGARTSPASLFEHFKREYRRALVRAYRADRARLDAESEQLQLTADRSAATRDRSHRRSRPGPWRSGPAGVGGGAGHARAQDPRRARRARPHVAGPQRHGAGARPVRVRRPRALGGRRRAHRRRAGAPVPRARPRPRRGGVDRRRPRVGRRSRRHPRPAERSPSAYARGALVASPTSTHAQRTVDELGVGAFTNASDILARYGSDAPAASADDDGELRTFGHVLVDEAQDLTAMQWRMLARRCPTGSMTLVGDFGQASRPGALSSWDDVVANLPVRVPPHRVPAHRQLPHAVGDHGRRQPAAARGRARGRARPAGAQHRGLPRGARGVVRRVGAHGGAGRARRLDHAGRHRGRHRAGRAPPRDHRASSPTAARSPTTSRPSTHRSRC